MAKTRKLHEEQFAAAGVVGHALELMVEAAGYDRHLSRVEDAREAAQAWAAENGWEGWQRNQAAALLLLLDMAGTGGPGGIGGDATIRLEPLRRLGKGRKRATDGEAWSAAINEAWQCLVAGYGPTRVGLQPNGQTLGLAVDGLIEVEIDPAKYGPDIRAAIDTVAQNGLRRSLGLRCPGCSGLPLQGRPGEWAELVNHLHLLDLDAASAASTAGA